MVRWLKYSLSCVSFCLFVCLFVFFFSSHFLFFFPFSSFLPFLFLRFVSYCYFFSCADDDKNSNRNNDNNEIQDFADEVVEVDEVLDDVVDTDEDSNGRSPRLRHRDATSNANRSVNRSREDYKPQRASNSMVLEEMESFDDDFGDDFI